ncbi:MAG: hypothetical protein ACW98K_10715, partial [Candidatus Kariarchaeaceae archaeon]
ISRTPMGVLNVCIYALCIGAQGEFSSNFIWVEAYINICSEQTNLNNYELMKKPLKWQYNFILTI